LTFNPHVLNIVFLFTYLFRTPQAATQPTLGTQKQHQQLQPHLQPPQELPQDEQPPRRAPKRKQVIDVDDSEIPTGVGTSPDNAMCLDD
jgi:hypothetical protein